MVHRSWRSLLQEALPDGGLRHTSEQVRLLRQTWRLPQMQAGRLREACQEGRTVQGPFQEPRGGLVKLPESQRSESC